MSVDSETLITNHDKTTKHASYRGNNCCDLLCQAPSSFDCHMPVKNMDGTECIIVDHKLLYANRQITTGRLLMS